MSSLKAWPKIYKIWLALALIGFWISGFIFSIQNGNHEFHRTDGATEQMLLFSTKTYVQEGFFKNWLLPTYPPFGTDGDGNNRTEPFVYTHYFPGPAWMQALLVKTIGENGIWISRLIPLTLNVLGLLFLAIEFFIYTNSSLLACVLVTALMTARAITIFSISFAGHGYVMGIYLFMLGYIFKLANESSSLKLVKGLFFTGVLIGFLQIEFAIDFLSVTFLSALGLIIMLKKISTNNAKKFLSGMILGGTIGMVLQVVLFSLHLGSASAAVDDFKKFGSWRMGIHNLKADAEEVHSLNQVLREYNRQAYGATGFTAWNLVALTALFIALGYLGKIKNTSEILRMSFGLVMTYFAAISWNVLMKQHSWIHIHFIPRHYIVLFVYFIIITLIVSKELVQRSARASV